MTESLPFAMPCPLGSELTSLLQPKEKSARKVAEAETKKGALAPRGNAQKKRRMMTVMRVVLDTSPLVIQKRTAPSVADEVADGPQDAKSSGGPLGTTLSEIDRIIADVVPKRDTEEVVATETLASKMKNTEEASSESKNFDLRHLGG
jgi:hypothetical protein